MAKEFADVEELLAKVAKVVGSEEFRLRSTAFVEEHCDAFSFDDENKLEYSQIHDRYQEEIEVALLDALPPEDVEALLEKLPAYMEKVSAADMDPVVGEALELLTNLGDFQAFKEIMLVGKRDKAGKAAPAPDALPMQNADLGVVGAEKLFEEMASATGKGGWEVRSDKGWYKVEMKKWADDRDYYRTTMVTDLTPDHCFNLFMDFEHPRRGEWMSHVKNIKLIKDNGPNDKVFRNELELTGLMKLALRSMPNTMDVRGITRHDFPEKGDRTVVLIPWNADTDQYDQSSKFMKLQTICFKPVKDSPNECVLIIMEENDLRWMPQWVQVMLINNVSPKFMSGMVSRYKKVVLE